MNLNKPGKIISIRQVAERTIEATIKVPEDFNFVAGRYLWLMIPNLKYPDPKGNARMFSIASSPKRKGELSIIFRTSDSGYKNTLVEMAPGAEVILSGPYGSMGLPEDVSIPVIFLAGGVGVAPFLSMIRFSTEINSGHKITLIYTNASKKEAAYLDELARIEEENQNFKLVAVFGILDKSSLSRFIKPDISWFVAGPRDFINNVAIFLNQSDVPPEKINFEQFYPDVVSKLDFKKKLISLGRFAVANEDPYLLALENSNQHFILTDPNGLILYANKAAEEITGYTFKEMTGNTPRLWGALMPEDFYKNLWQTIKYDRRPFLGEIKNRRKNQEEYYALVRISPIIDNNDNLTGFVATEEDVTEEKNIENAKNEFISLASHQLRTPPSIINWYAETLQSGELGPVNEKQADYLKEIYQANQRMIMVIDSLLNISRIEMNTFSISCKEIDVKAIIDETIQELASRFNRKAKIKKDYDPTLGTLNADPNIMTIIIDNLLSNAFKYSPPGKTEIEITIKKENDSFFLSVKDNGIGIPSKDEGKIFEKLFRADNAVSANSDGTGIGLYMIRKIIVDGLGGKIWFNSKENEGTTFFVSFSISRMKNKVGATTLAQVPR